MAHATRRFAKRQLTWFRGDSQVVWRSPEITELQSAIDSLWGRGTPGR